MTARRLAQVALLAVVIVTLAIVFRPQGNGRQVAAADAPGDVRGGAEYVAYYFHGDVRCDTCRSIEAQSEAAVRSGFADALAAGTLAWRAVNTDQPENAHFVEEYGLTHSTLVLVERAGGETRRFTLLDRVWELVHDDEDAFREYVQDGIAEWMRADT